MLVDFIFCTHKLTDSMAKVFKEEQRFHDRIAIIAIVAIMLLILYAILSPFIRGQIQFPYLNIAIFLAIVTGAVLLILRIRMHFSISKKKIQIKVSPFRARNLVITREEVEEIRFFKINEAVISSGLTVHFGDKTKNFYMGDRAGIIIRLNNGKNRVVFSDSLYLDRERITSALKSNGWKVADEANVTALT